MKRIFSVLLSFVMTFSIVTGLNLTASANDIYNIQVKGICDYAKANEVLKIVNEERSANGLNALSMDSELLNAAMDRAMENGIYYSHTRPDGSTCFTICNKINGENIAVNYLSSESVMNGWMNSSGHRANILGSNYKSIGIGCFKVNSVYYWVQSFSTKAAENIPNKSGTVEKANTISIQKSLVKLYAYVSTSNMRINQSGQFKYGIINQGWTTAYCTGVASDYTFSSSDPTVVSIDSQGKFTAIGEGTSTISVKLKADSNQSYSKKITVNGNAPTTNFTTQTKTPKTTAEQIKTTKTSASQTKTTKSSATQAKTTKTCATQAKTTKSSIKQATITKLTANRTGKKINVTWGKVKKADGYQVQASTKKFFNKKSIVCNKLTQNTRLNINAKKIKNCHTCYIRVRAYSNRMNSKGIVKRSFSKWKRTKKIKIY